MFSLNQPLCCDPGMIWRRGVYLRVCDGLISVLLALRKKPLIRLAPSWAHDPHVDSLELSINCYMYTVCSDCEVHDICISDMPNHLMCVRDWQMRYRWVTTSPSPLPQPAPSPSLPPPSLPPSLPPHRGQWRERGNYLTSRLMFLPFCSFWIAVTTQLPHYSTR